MTFVQFYNDSQDIEPAQYGEDETGRIPEGWTYPFSWDHQIEIAKCTVDPIYFIERYIRVANAQGQLIPFKLYPFQKRLLRHYITYNKTVSIIARQSGKTQSAAAFLLWYAMFKPKQKILIASHKGDAAKDIMQRIKDMYVELPKWIKPKDTEWNVFSIKFANDSKIEAETTTENTGRGKTITLFYCDELAFVRPNIANGFWTSIFPTITSSSDRRCIITSTANTDEDLFARIWLNCKKNPESSPWLGAKDIEASKQEVEEEKYETLYEDEAQLKLIERENEADSSVQGFWGFHAHWTEVPNRDENFRIGVLSSGVTEAEWQRDFECRFLTKDETLISAGKLLALNSTIRPPRFVDRWGGRWFEYIKPNTAYAVALDPSEGVGRDDACIQVFELPTLKQVMEWSSNTFDQNDQAKMLMRTLGKIYATQNADPEHDPGRCDIYYSVERNGLGVGILTAIQNAGEHDFPGWLIDSAGNKSRGLLTTSTTKKRFAIEMASLLERNLMTIRSKRLLSQLKVFVQRGQKFEAKPGERDDLVMGVILLCQLVEEVRFNEGDLDDRISVDLVDEPEGNDVPFLIYT